MTQVKRKSTIFYGILLGVFLLFFMPVGITKTISQDLSSATILQFIENEPPVGQYPVTMTLSKEFLRIDDTEEGKDYIVFSRMDKIIYSINSQDQQILVIKNRPVSRKSPLALNVAVKAAASDMNAPDIEGRKTRHFQVWVNDKLCEDIFALADFLPDAVKALKNFKDVLAGQQAEVLQHLPADIHEPCDLAKNTFYPALTLDKGFPVMEISADGYSRLLINYYRQDVDNKLFELPENYRRFNLN